MEPFFKALGCPLLALGLSESLENCIQMSSPIPTVHWEFSMGQSVRGGGEGENKVAAFLILDNEGR